MFHGGDDLANIRSEAESRELHRQILTAATVLFMQKGFEKTTLMDIAKLSGVPKTKILYEMNSKEEILGHLVVKFLDGVTEASDAVSEKLTDDRLLIFIANEVLQIYMAEMSEDMRNLYLSAYSMQKTSEAIIRRRADMMYEHFGAVFPGEELKDFYEREIASTGIMRAYITVPCDIYFTAEAKAKKLVEMLLLIYRAEEKRISEALGFIGKIDFEAVAKKAVEDVFRELDIKNKQ